MNFAHSRDSKGLASPVLARAYQVLNDYNYQRSSVLVGKEMKEGELLGGALI